MLCFRRIYSVVLIRMFLFQSSVDSTASSPPSTKAVKRKAPEISTAVVQRSATIGSSPVLYSQSAIAAGKHHDQSGFFSIYHLFPALDAPGWKVRRLLIGNATYIYFF